MWLPGKRDLPGRNEALETQYHASGSLGNFPRIASHTDFKTGITQTVYMEVRMFSENLQMTQGLKRRQTGTPR